jgi:hypothetical protein
MPFHKVHYPRQQYHVLTVYIILPLYAHLCPNHVQNHSKVKATAVLLALLVGSKNVPRVAIETDPILRALNQEYGFAGIYAGC